MHSTKNPTPQRKKGAWSRRPPQPAKPPTPRSQSPVPPIPPIRKHLRRPSTLTRGVFIQDGVSVHRGNLSAVQEESVEGVEAPFPSSPATFPPKSEGVKFFGSIPATTSGYANRRASGSSRASVVLQLAPAAQSTSSSTSTPVSQSAADGAATPPTPSPTAKPKIDIKKMFQNPSSAPNSTPSNTSSLAMQNTFLPGQIQSLSGPSSPSRKSAEPRFPGMPMWPSYYHAAPDQQQYMYGLPACNRMPTPSKSPQAPPTQPSSSVLISSQISLSTSMGGFTSSPWSIPSSIPPAPPVTGPNRLSARSSTFVPREITVRNQDSVEVDLGSLKGSVSANSVLDGSDALTPSTPHRRPTTIRIETEDQRKARLGEEKRRIEAEGKRKKDEERNIKEVQKLEQTPHYHVNHDQQQYMNGRYGHVPMPANPYAQHQPQPGQHTPTRISENLLSTLQHANTHTPQPRKRLVLQPRFKLANKPDIEEVDKPLDGKASLDIQTDVSLGEIDPASPQTPLNLNQTQRLQKEAKRSQTNAHSAQRQDGKDISSFSNNTGDGANPVVPRTTIASRVKDLLCVLSTATIDLTADHIVVWVEIAQKGKGPWRPALQQVVGTIVDEAVAHPAQSVIYAQLCSRVMGKANGKIREPLKRFLREKCWEAYVEETMERMEESEADGKATASTNNTPCTKDEQQDSAPPTSRLIGVSTFIQALYNMHSLTERVVDEFIGRLFFVLDSGSSPLQEGVIEPLCILLQTIEPQLKLVDAEHFWKRTVYMNKLKKLAETPSPHAMVETQTMLQSVIQGHEPQWHLETRVEDTATDHRFTDGRA